MCFALGLRPAVAETIFATHVDPEQCLREVIIRWLRKTYDVDRHGPPTWRTLVKAVSDKAGGNNPALAEGIAKEHQGITTSRQIIVAIFCKERAGYLTTEWLPWLQTNWRDGDYKRFALVLIRQLT